MPFDVFPVSELRLNIVMRRPSPELEVDRIFDRPSRPIEQPTPIEFGVIDVVPARPSFRSGEWRSAVRGPAGELLHLEALALAQHRRSRGCRLLRSPGEFGEPTIVLEHPIRDELIE